MDYDDALSSIIRWHGWNVLVLFSFKMPGIGFEDRPFIGRLLEGLVPPEPGKRLLTVRHYINGELQSESDDGRHFSVWSSDPSVDAQERPILHFSLFRSTFSESAPLEAGKPENGLMVRHGMFRWVICPQS